MNIWKIRLKDLQNIKFSIENAPKETEAQGAFTKKHECIIKYRQKGLFLPVSQGELKIISDEKEMTYCNSGMAHCLSVKNFSASSFLHGIPFLRITAVHYLAFIPQIELSPVAPEIWQLTIFIN